MSSSLPELVNLCVYSTPAAYKLTVSQACINKYQNDGDISICGDFNSRCSDLEYFIAGVDDVPQRNVVDFKTKSYGEILIDFLINTNLCILNGRNCLSIYVNFCERFVCSWLLPRQSKRKHWLKIQSEFINECNSHDVSFWKTIGRVGVEQNRKQPIPMEVVLDDGNVSTKTHDVSNKWKADFSSLDIKCR